MLLHQLAAAGSFIRRRYDRRATRMQPVMTQAVSSPAKAISGADFIRPHLRKLAAYTPIEPFDVLSKKYGIREADIIKLDANENPYGPPPEVREALANMQFPHIYPDPETRALRAALSADCGVPAANLLVGCGADELIDLLMRCVLNSGDAIVDCPPTFTMYAFDAAVNDARVIRVPRRADFSIDVAAVTAAVAAHAPKMLFVTSPNNPDGSELAESDLVSLLSLPVLVVLDEAYVDFSTTPSRVGWVTRHENLVVLRTFSKRCGLAGLRVGYGAFPSSMVDYLWRAKQPYNVSVAAEVAGVAALANPRYLDDVRDRLLAERTRLQGLLTTIPYLRPHPSAANFVLCTVEGRDACALKQALAARGIMVRHYAKADLANYIRISVGKPEHTDALIAVLRSL